MKKTLLVIGCFFVGAIASAQIQNDAFWARKFPTAAGRTSRSLMERLSEMGNVKDLGVKGDGTDETAAVQAAVDALPDSGGILYFPDGIYKFNVVINKYNVRFFGESMVKASNGGDQILTAFVPADLSRDLIQVGNDTREVRGFRIENITLNGGTNTHGNVGIAFRGGAYECFARNLVVWNFATNFVFQAGTNFACSIIHIDGFASQSSTNTDARGMYIGMQKDQASYTTGIYLTGGHVDGPTGAGSFAIEVDGSTATLQNSYYDLADGHGVFMNQSQSGTLVPALSGFDVDFDGGSSSAVILTLSTNLGSQANVALWPNWLDGEFRIQGRLQTANGTLLNSLASQHIREADAYILHMDGSIYFDDFTDRTSGTNSGSLATSLARSGTSLVMQNLDGAISMIPYGALNIAPQGTNGSVAISGGTAGLTFDLSGKGSATSSGGSYILHDANIYLDNAHGINFEQFDGSQYVGVLSMTSSDGVLLNANTNLAEVVGTNGLIGFYTGATQIAAVDATGLIARTNLTLPNGATLSMAIGSNSRAGNVVLVGGTVTVSNSSVTDATLLIPVYKTFGGTTGTLSYTTTASTGFTITSSSATDTSTVSYILIENP
jgi:hypothetical protein